ncbi:hypothetical protein ILUMI_08057 [Ignelater luminosus]|uniref:Reverse transcriptase domain-containing protein n=1 Tax=Ignelater luminosus TaxID=2038154 RepID=A0A8K0D2A7_IGNLU|nr:hypothetical protein ILUMI_08057 [Ignelater luminosus]
MGEAGRFDGDALEDIVHEAVHDRHGLAGNAGVQMDLFQHLVDVDGVAFLLLIALRDVLLWDVKSSVLNCNNSTHQVSLAVTSFSSPPHGLSKATPPVIVNEFNTLALIDTGGTASFINEQLAKDLKMQIKLRKEVISLASTTFQSSVLGQCCINMQFGGPKSPLDICGLATANVEPASLFSHLTPDCKPICTKSREFNPVDTTFINDEIRLISTNSNHKRLVAIDYSQTINRYTLLDAHPLPNIEQIVNDGANYTVFSTIDLKCEFHQIPIRTEDKKYTAFEAEGQLVQFKWMPFGVTNGGRESTVLTRDLVDENRSDPIKIPSPSQEKDYTQVFSPSDPVPLQNSPDPTVATPLL